MDDYYWPEADAAGKTKQGPALSNAPMFLMSVSTLSPGRNSGMLRASFESTASELSFNQEVQQRMLLPGESQ